MINLNINRLHPNSYKNLIQVLILFALVYMPVFGYLNALPIRIWDEARLAINAWEMHQNGNYVVTYFGGNPDMWNTKPPLIIWAQVLFIKIIGFNELSIRLPIAFSVFFTMIALYLFFAKYLKQSWFGFIVVMVLITSSGYIGDHVARTGDYDAPLVLFLTLSSLLLFTYIQKNNNLFLYGFFICLTLAALTKGIAGLMLGPAWLIYLIIRKKLLTTLKNKHLYFGLLGFIVIVLGYYLLREINNPGYIKAVQINEIGGRYIEVKEGHSSGFWHYYRNLIDFKYTAWFVIMICGMITGLTTKDSKIKHISIFSTVISVTYFLIISISQTKLNWYDAPLYPFMAINVACFLSLIFKLLSEWELITKTLKPNLIPYIFLFLVMLTPYNNIISKTYKPVEASNEKDFYEISHFLKKSVKGKYQIDNYTLLYNGYNAHLDFYLIQLKEKGIEVQLTDKQDFIKPGSQIIINQGEFLDDIQSKHSYQTIEEHGNIKLIKIL